MLFKTSLPLNPPSKSILIIFEREIGIIQRKLSDSYLIGIIPMVSRFHWIFIGNVTLCGVIFKAQWLQILSLQLYLSTVFFAFLLQFVHTIQLSVKSKLSNSHNLFALGPHSTYFLWWMVPHALFWPHCPNQLKFSRSQIILNPTSQWSIFWKSSRNFHETCSLFYINKCIQKNKVMLWRKIQGTVNLVITNQAECMPALELFRWMENHFCIFLYQHFYF